ncbi:general stress protein 39 [Fomitopsis serialis]|uniref:general stress protein 39 n=1 Tax=Fomitopsis serialis TaxID=139415 RepID=UPI002008AC20|nr:general stress protein 39 [Neoantrodia serialis]KAH9932858.1 general stress protein 39 [Neoantrodia serialis]
MAHEGTTLKQKVPAQEQDLPGLQKAMSPEPFDTSLETGSGPNHTPEWQAARKEGTHYRRRVVSNVQPHGQSRLTRSSSRVRGDVTIVHLPSEQKDADDTVAAIQREGRRALSVAFDLEDFRGAHIIEPDFASIDLDSVESTFRSNILQMFAVTKFALPHLERGSSIINTTSVTTFRGSPTMVDYVSTKGAIVGFTRSLAKQLEPKGIRVNAVAPGPVHTPLQPASRSAEQMEGFGEKSSIGRVGQPSEIAPTYVFLASAEAELYYGQIMHPYPLGD